MPVPTPSPMFMAIARDRRLVKANTYSLLPPVAGHSSLMFPTMISSITEPSHTSPI